MNAREIATALLAAPHITDDAIEPLRAFRRAKRKTGAPVDLEDSAIAAAESLFEHVAALRLYLERAEKEARDALAAMATADSYAFHRTWFQLDNRNSAERLAGNVERYHKAFFEAVSLWAALTDRIVATPEDVARREEQERAAAAALAPPARRRKQGTNRDDSAQSSAEPDMALLNDLENASRGGPLALRDLYRARHADVAVLEKRGLWFVLSATQGNITEAGAAALASANK